MSRSSPMHVALLIALFALIVNSASSQATRPISGRKAFIQELNQFVSCIDRSFRSVSSSLKSLNEDFRMLGEIRLGKLNSTVRGLEALNQHPELGVKAPKTAACRYGWIKYGPSCFTFTPCSVNDTRNSCMKNQSQLAKVSSATQEQFFVDSLKTAKNIILGGNDRNRDGTWSWRNGSVLKSGYSRWGSVTSASSQATNPMSKRRAFIQKLNKFVTYVDRGFRSVSSSLKSLKEDFRLIGEVKLDKLNSTVLGLEDLGVKAPKTAACRDGWNKYGPSCFTFTLCHNGCSVNDARNSCMKNQSQLAKVSSATQEQFFVDSLKTAKIIILGGNDRNKDGTWRWPDGSVMKGGFSRWGSGEPDGSRNEYCMYGETGSNRPWDDVGCGHKFVASQKPDYICESSPTSS